MARFLRSSEATFHRPEEPGAHQGRCRRLSGAAEDAATVRDTQSELNTDPDTREGHLLTSSCRSGACTRH